MQRYGRLALFLGAVLGAGFTVGLLAIPGPWYESLRKPWFNPPNWVFGPAWTFLYILIAIAGWRLWERRAPAGPKRLWILQMVLNFAWSPIFFAAQLPSVAVVVALGMLGSIVAFIASTWRVDRVASWLFLPYAAWVTFATLLNAAIIWLN